MTDKPNAPDKNGQTLIYWAAYFGHTEIVKILAPLTDYPNASSLDGITPMDQAALWEHREIVKTLAPFADHNPNAIHRIIQSFKTCTIL